MIKFRCNANAASGLMPKESWSILKDQDIEDGAPDGILAEATTQIRHGLLPPRDASRQSTFDGEVITYVKSGSLAYEDCLGDIGVITAGEFSRTAAQQGACHSVTNPSTSDWASVYQIWLHSSGDVKHTRHEQRRFSTAERQGALRLVASRDGRNGSLRVMQDIFLFSAELSSGKHIVHALAPGRCAWLHVVEGSVKFRDCVLATGDSVETSDEISVSFTSLAETEVLLLDMKTTMFNAARDGAPLQSGPVSK